jgi:uncharacterized protein YdhG (YjbR/CyaY superfamily)
MSPAKKSTAPRPKANGFTAEERGAMRDRVRELRAAKSNGEPEVLAKIASMPKADRAIGERLHAIIRATAPTLSTRLWYGMPAYTKDGEIVCFFQAADKFKARYATLGFSDEAKLDDGAMWPTAFALTEMTPTVEARVAALVKRAIG